MQQALDYTPFLALFGKDGTLTLTHQMTISAEACTILEHVFEEALSRPLAALPGKQAVELLNRDAVTAQEAPFIQIKAEGAGTLSMPIGQMHLVPLNDIVQRFLADIETFELFLFDQDLPNRHAYRYNLTAWSNMKAATILDYRMWLPRYVLQDQHDAKLAIVQLYCHLANKAGFLTEDEVAEIEVALDKQLPSQRKSGTSRAKQK
jgi:hypothetical protein